jgi:predicted secreted protein
MNGASRRLIGLALGLAAATTIGPALAGEDAAWADIRAYLFPDRAIHDGAGVIRLSAPERAHDAVVPIEIEALIPQAPER